MSKTFTAGSAPVVDSALTVRWLLLDSRVGGKRERELSARDSGTLRDARRKDFHEDPTVS